MLFEVGPDQFYVILDVCELPPNFRNSREHDLLPTVDPADISPHSADGGNKDSHKHTRYPHRYLSKMFVVFLVVINSLFYASELNTHVFGAIPKHEQIFLRRYFVGCDH
jgi:hypothetical protein